MMRSRVALGPFFALSTIAATFAPTALAQTPDMPPPAQVAPAAPASPYPEAPPPPAYPGAGVAPGTATSGAMPAPGAKNSDDESRDSGLGLEWFWLNLDVGASYVGLDSINSSTFSLQHSSSAGGAFGVGAGVRLVFFTLGARARDLQLSLFNLWEIEGEAAFHMRIDHFDPYFGLRGGYAFDGALSSSAVGSAGGTSPDVSVHGYVAGLAVGCDYYFNHFLSLGLDLNPEFLFLQRPKVALPPGPVGTAIMNSPAYPLYQESGSSVGFGFTGTAHLGVHL